MKTFSTQDGNDVRKDARRVTMSIPKRTRRARARCLFIGVWFLTWWRHSRASPVSLDNSFPFSLSSLRLSDSNELIVSLKKKKTHHRRAPVIWIWVIAAEIDSYQILFIQLKVHYSFILIFFLSRWSLHIRFGLLTLGFSTRMWVIYLFFK